MILIVITTMTCALCMICLLFFMIYLFLYILTRAHCFCLKGYQVSLCFFWRFLSGQHFQWSDFAPPTSWKKLVDAPAEADSVGNTEIGCEQLLLALCCLEMDAFFFVLADFFGVR